MTNPFFHSELKLLQELASEFALANPALAPLLDGSNRTDPDVERLLEAMAFQNAMLRRKLECDFPELIQKLVQLILPHYLRPIPATTIIGFTPRSAMAGPVTIPAGTRLDSAPVDGTPCRFRTSADVELHPLEITCAAVAQQSGRGAEIRLSLLLHGLPLSDWQPGKVRLFLAGEHAAAGELYLLLSRHVTRIILTPAEGGTPCELPVSCLTPAGFAEDEELLPYPPQAFPGYRMLQEYFSTPEKFLFFDLSGWEQWQQRGDGAQFSITFELDSLPSGPLRIRRESFALHAVPAVNLFAHDADPISVNHRAGHYLVRPAGPNPAHNQIFSVDKVTGYSRATNREREYQPFELFSGDNTTEPAYHTLLAQSQRHSEPDLHLGLAFAGEIPTPDSETLSIALTCSNGTLPENLRIGDIAQPLTPLPASVTGRNITPVNPGQTAPLGAGLLRQLTSHLYLNHLSLERVEHLRTLLELYVFPDQRSAAGSAANLKRIAGIEALEVRAGELLVDDIPMRGREIRIRIRQDHFAGAGDMYLFGSVLDRFLGRYASINSYTRLEFYETLRGGTWQWPTRLGSQTLR
ncbi:MAG: type VI secretion system baseplate subunit TssF [Geobacter sp.]|nr:type VI secretion system baseplate subunit TssF [Geobacter sp.]